MKTLQRTFETIYFLRSWMRLLAWSVVIGWFGSPLLQATDTTWTYNGDGNWTTPANWDNGEPATVTYNAFVDDGDTSVTVTLNADRAVGNLSIGSDDRVIIANGRALLIDHELSGGGVLSILSSGSLTDLLIESEVTLTGGGEVVLGGHTYARILDKAYDPTGHLINENNIVHGRGQIGAGRMQITNQAGGIIDADQPGVSLIIFPNASGVANTGIMQASAGGILNLQMGTFTNTGGTIQALDGSAVQLYAATITGGTLATNGSGVIETDGAAINVLENVTCNGSIRINNAGTIQLAGTMNNTETIQVVSTGASTNLAIESEVTLTGGGEVVLSRHDNARILDESGDLTGHLINVDNTIHGRGQIGVDRMQITNQAGGMIDADQSGFLLTIDPNDAGAINTGTMQASAGGILKLQDGTFSNTGGSIQALDSSSVKIAAATIINGTLTTTGSGIIETYTGNLNVLEDLSIKGFLRVNNSDNVQLVGSINNTGTIQVASTGANTNLTIESEVTLTGGGEIVLSGNTNVRILDAVDPRDGHLINVDNAIRGRGQIGVDRMQITNQAGGMIDADQPGSWLRIDPNIAGMSNAGTMQASLGCILYLQNGTFTNTGGTIQALDASYVRLNAARITGGTLTTTGSGVIESDTSPINVLEDLTSNGFLRVNNGHTIQLVGTINNTNTIQVASTGGNTTLLIDSEVTLTGSGEIYLSGNYNARILDGSGDPTGHLINENNTIHGRGQIGFGQTQITNQADGTIQADVAGAVLEVSPNSAGVTNAGMMQATSGGILRLAAGTFTNTGGSIHAADGSTIKLRSSAISGGTVSTTGSGLIETYDGSLNVLEALTSNGLVRVNNGHNLRLAGTIVNTGSIEVASTGGNTDLRIEDEVTLTGGGEILLSGHPNARLLDQSGAVEGRLINQDNTIRGRGQLGASRLLEVVNNGAIIGDSATVLMPITVPLSGTGSLANVQVSSTHTPGNSTAVIDMSGLYKMTGTAVLNIELGGTTPGTGHDQLDSDGTVQLAGTLNVSRIDLGGGLYEPDIGDTFVILHADNGVNGMFSKTNLDDTPPTGALEIVYKPNDVILRYGKGDVDEDGDVDGNDFLVWQRGYEMIGGATFEDGDFNLDGNVDKSDLWIWKQSFGDIITEGSSSQTAVPEPLAITSALVLIGCLAIGRHRKF